MNNNGTVNNGTVNNGTQTVPILYYGVDFIFYFE
jgi:hypothetical protein